MRNSVDTLSSRRSAKNQRFVREWVTYWRSNVLQYYPWRVQNRLSRCARVYQILIFIRSRKKFSTTCAIVLFFFCFFFSQPFHENFKFLKNCPYDFHEILHSRSTPKGAPACAKASKSFGWDVRNIAKISPKMAKKQPFFYFFRFSRKLSIRFERNFLQLFYTILESYMCNGIKIVWLGCEKHSQN